MKISKKVLSKRFHTKWWQIFNWDFLPGWVKGYSRNLQGLVSLGQLTPLLAGSS